MSTRRGFSLLEVMVAIAILGLTLTVILSAQGGLAASNRSAANMGQAIALGRCKMSEIEEVLLKLGYQELDQIESAVACCQDEVREGFTCDTRIEKVELPNFQASSGIDGGVAGMGGDGGPAAGSPLSTLTSLTSGDGGSLSLDGGLQGLAGQVGGGAGTEGLLNMVMGLVYPGMKPMFEASIRRVTVTVKWKEGPNARELPLVQFVTNPQRAGFAANALLPDGGAMDFGAGGVQGAGGGALGGGAGGAGAKPMTPGGVR